ncbi:MAG: hypothetical protein DRG78_06085 [Epsilonproteobacteria bacterium]|nr:MAG: hypothetical protein DRG78_06085 [Campylobacterota bacterium]
MIKNKINLSLVTAMMITTCSYAGTVTAPNSIDIKLSGDIELKAVSEKTDSEKISKRTAEVNLNLDATLKNGIKVFTTFKAFDGTQGQTTAGAENTDDGFKTKIAYAVIPLMKGNGKIVAGLTPMITYGTDAFDDGGEAWQGAVSIPVAKGVKVTVVSKVLNEEEVDSNKGDSGANAIRVDTKINNIMIGAKYANGYKNKADGFTGAEATTELKSKVFMTYVTGRIAGLNVGFEYARKDITKVGANAMQQFKDIQVGYFTSVEKEIGKFTTGLSYLNLSKGMKGGDDFKVGLILDGNIDSSVTKDTTAFVVPIKYKINDKFTTNITLIKAEVLEESTKEIDLGLTYAMDENVEMKIETGKYMHKNSTNDQTNMQLAVAIKF